MKMLILNISTQSTAKSGVKSTDSFKLIFNCTSLYRAQIVFSHLLKTKNIHIEVTFAFIQDLVSVYWVFRGSTNPGKLSLFLLGHSLMHNKPASTEKASLFLQLQEVNNNQLSNESISSLIA